eukprot:XP_001610947.1 PRY domain containing protein [Babesia bovis T2Bo]
MTDLLNLLYGDLIYPTTLNVRNHHHYVQVRSDKVTVDFTGKGKYCDPASVQAERPAPSDCVLYYYEATVLQSDKPAKVVVGFSERNTRMNRLPGEEDGTVGYRGQYGDFSNGKCKWESYGSSYQMGDVIGCGINYINQCYFFTRNGVYQGDAGKLCHNENFPTIGLNQHMDAVKCNFEGPFVFDILGEYRRIVARERREINQQKIDSVSLDDIVQLYLLHGGYLKSLESFKKERNSKCNMEGSSSKASSSPEHTIDSNEPFHDTKPEEFIDSQRKNIAPFYISDEAIERLESSLNLRHHLRQLITSGDTAEALKLLNQSFPNINKSSFSYCRLIHQHFLETVLKGHVSEAIQWLRETYDFNLNNKPRFKKMFEETASILCHREHNSHSVRDKYSGSRLVSVADAINNIATG